MSQNQQNPNSQSPVYNIDDGIKRLLEYAKKDPKKFELALGDNEEAFEQYCKKRLKDDFRNDSDDTEKLAFLNGYEGNIKGCNVNQLKIFGISEENANRLKSNWKSKKSF